MLCASQWLIGWNEERHQQEVDENTMDKIGNRADCPLARESGVMNAQEQQTHHEQQQQLDNNSEQPANETSNRPKRNPYCSRCRNHGKSNPVKGHKRHCEYRSCICDGCWLVQQRQEVSAAQIKRRRYQKQDEECGRQIEITPPVLNRGPPTTLTTAPHKLQQQASSSASSSSLPLSDALHLFLASINPQQHVQTTTTTTTGQLVQSANSPNLNNPAWPNIRQQINLVEEIHHSFGPLAIYAWLRSEQFDLQKVRDSIELSRPSFDELLQVTGHSPLDLTYPIVD